MTSESTATRVRPWFIGLLIVAVLGCQDEQTRPSVPAGLGVLTAPSTAARSGVPFDQQPVVELLDQSGNPVAVRAIQVTATLVSGTGTLSGGVIVRTDDRGRAAFVDLRLAGAAGPFSLQFSAPGLAPTPLQAVVLGAGPGAAIEALAGNSQVAPAGTDLPVAPTVRVTDDAGNPVPGLAVAFAVTEGGGSVEGPTPTTGADGLASVTRWTIGRVIGRNTLVASVAGLSRTFTATGTVGPAAKLLFLSGEGQNGNLGSPVAVSPTLKVTDAFDNPLAGVQVNFSVDKGGRVTGGSPQTDQLGVAAVGTWVLGLVPGTQTLTARLGAAPPATLTAAALDFQVTAVAAGPVGACAIGTDGRAMCWGSNVTGRVGDGTLIDRTEPTPVLGGHSFESISVGTGHACAVTASGVGYCWGANSTGQLGDGSTTPASDPRPVAGGHLWKSIVAGDVHTCGLDTNGAAWCWGSNGNGRLGDGAIIARLGPTPVAGGHSFLAVTAGAAHTCGLRSDNQILCWGSGANGRLGVGGTIDQRTPAVVTVAGVSFSAVSAGGSHTCAVTAAGGGMCWGNGAAGALGDGGTGQLLVPGAVAGTEVYRMVSAGLAHTCAVTQGDQLFCWGANGSGRLGDGSAVTRLVPTAIAAGTAFSAVATGSDHSCARTTLGSALCWGGGLLGQLGTGTAVSQPRPVGVNRPRAP